MSDLTKEQRAVSRKKTANPPKYRMRPYSCDWSSNGDDCDTWDTGCGKVFCINERETPEDAGMRYCCFCGGEVRQHMSDAPLSADWRVEFVPYEWALPLFVRWVYNRGDVFYVVVHFLCFYVCYERWLSE